MPAPRTTPNSISSPPVRASPAAPFQPVLHPNCPVRNEEPSRTHCRGDSGQATWPVPLPDSFWLSRIVVGSPCPGSAAISLWGTAGARIQPNPTLLQPASRLLTLAPRASLPGPVSWSCRSLSVRPIDSRHTPFILAPFVIFGRSGARRPRHAHRIISTCQLLCVLYGPIPPPLLPRTDWDQLSYLRVDSGQYPASSSCKKRKCPNSMAQVTVHQVGP